MQVLSFTIKKKPDSYPTFVAHCEMPIEEVLTPFKRFLSKRNIYLLDFCPRPPDRYLDDMRKSAGRGSIEELEWSYDKVKVTLKSGKMVERPYPVNVAVWLKKRRIEAESCAQNVVRMTGGEIFSLLGSRSLRKEMQHVNLSWVDLPVSFPPEEFGRVDVSSARSKYSEAYSGKYGYSLHAPSSTSLWVTKVGQKTPANRLNFHLHDGVDLSLSSKREKDFEDIISHSVVYLTNYYFSWSSLTKLPKRIVSWLIDHAHKGSVVLVSTNPSRRAKGQQPIMVCVAFSRNSSPCAALSETKKLDKVIELDQQSKQWMVTDAI